MNVVKARALALACRPVGNAAQSSPGGNDQSASTTLTAPDFSSGVNIHSDPPMERPRPAALTLVIDDGLMPEKIAWVLGNPHSIEICGAAADDPSAYRDLARNQR